MDVDPAACRVLAKFRAGRAKLEERTIKPDTRKGLLRVIQAEDGLTHLEWLERSEAGAMGQPELDTIVFPNEATFERIPGQRMFVLKFKEDKSRNEFFWTQEPDASADEANRSKVEQALNGLTVDPEEAGDMAASIAAAMQLALGQGVTGTSSLERGALSDAFAAGMEVVQGDSMGIVGAGPGQAPAAVGHADASLAGQLAAMLSSMAAQGGAAPPPAAAAAVQRPPQDAAQSLAAALAAGLAAAQHAQQRHVAPGPGLAEVLKPEVLAPLLREPDVLDRLAPFMPEEHRSADQLSALARSPQFVQQMQALSAALTSGQLDLRQFGLQARGFSVADFLTAIQEMVDKENASSGAGGGGAAGSGSGGGPEDMQQ